MSSDRMIVLKWNRISWIYFYLFTYTILVNLLMANVFIYTCSNGLRKQDKILFLSFWSRIYMQAVNELRDRTCTRPHTPVFFLGKLSSHMQQKFIWWVLRYMMIRFMKSHANTSAKQLIYPFPLNNLIATSC